MLPCVLFVVLGNNVSQKTRSVTEKERIATPVCALARNDMLNYIQK